MMTTTRREFLELASLGLIAGIATRLPIPLASAATPAVRMPLSEFVKNDEWVRELRRGVDQMKKRKPSDPLSWFFQASIHGVTPQMMIEAARNDPEVANVNFVRYWNQCPHNQQHSANFLPWHRAYTHHFEQILKMHIGNDGFALPYWDYSHFLSPDWDANKPDRVKFPRVFGIQKADGVDNPLYHAQRDYFLCGYDHPFTDQLPLSELTAGAVDFSRAMATPVFFGDTESEGLGGAVLDTESSTRGLLEQSPHDQIHRVVGGRVQGVGDGNNPSLAIGGMAIPMTAGFDPIFPVHHSNIDRLWAKWACMPNKSWGSMPSSAWFNETPWFFFDLDGKEVARPRKDYFDYRALGVRFADEDLSCTPLALPTDLPIASVTAPSVGRTMSSLEFDRRIEVKGSGTTVLSLLPARANIPTSVSSVLSAERPSPDAAAIRLTDVHIHGGSTTGFDVHLVRKGTSSQNLARANATFLGSISLFNHEAAEHGGAHKINQVFYVTKAMRALSTASLAALDLVFIPYELATPPKMPHPNLSLSPATLMAADLSIAVRSRPNR